MHNTASAGGVDTETDTQSQQPRSGFSGPDAPQYEDYARCIHCGLCLNHCPTYKLWGLEADSPRGRIRQMLLVDQGALELGAEAVLLKVDAHDAHDLA